MSDAIEDEGAGATGESLRGLSDSLRSVGLHYSPSELAVLYSPSELAVSGNDQRAELEEQLSQLREFTRKLYETRATERTLRIRYEHERAMRLAERLLPRGARGRSFKPHYEDLHSRFVEDMGRCVTSKEMAHRCRGFAWEVRWAIALTWRALAGEASTRSIRWVAVALLGDGAVRVVYWAFTEVLRRL